MPDDHSKLVPLLPIPNRTVKRLCADDSADSRVKVGHRQALTPPNPLVLPVLGGFGFSGPVGEHAGCQSSVDHQIAVQPQCVAAFQFREQAIQPFLLLLIAVGLHRVAQIWRISGPRQQIVARYCSPFQQSELDQNLDRVSMVLFRRLGELR